MTVIERIPHFTMYRESEPMLRQARTLQVSSRISTKRITGETDRKELLPVSNSEVPE
jgi:hypothetical protein